MASKYRFEVVIDRSKWACGGRATGLKNKDGTMCCLGFLGEAVGARGLTKHEVPENLMTSQRVKYPYGLDTDECMELNDNEADQKAREAGIKAKFNEAGIKLTYKGKLHPKSRNAMGA
jgi:hypothetical protein